MIRNFLFLILKLVFFVISWILNLIFTSFPELTFVNSLLATFGYFFAFCGKAINLLYFVSGDLIFTFIDIWFVLFTFKHVALPVLNFTRKAIMDLF